MTGRSRLRLASPVTAWALLTLALGMTVAFGVLFYSPVTPAAYLANGGAVTGFWAFPLAAVPIVGALIALRRPENAIGWVCLATGVALGSSLLGGIVGSLMLNAHQGAGGYVELLAAIFNGNTSPGLGALVIVLLLFPDGHLPSARWRWVLGVLIVVLAAGLILDVINPAPGALDLGNRTSVFAIPSARSVVNTLTVPVNVAVNGIGVAAVVSIFLQLRGAGTERRHQIRWVAYAGGLALLIYSLTTTVAPNSPSGAVLVLMAAGVVVAGLAVPTAIAIAVLKYRLYDIDVIISRTLVYGALAAFITAVYVGIAVGVGSLVGSGGQPNLGLSILATIIVAVGFQPVRERLQHVANRLVYGKRATPYEVLSEFSGQVADAYAADEVLPRMARVLQEGTGAETATVWLRAVEQLRPAATVPEEVVAYEQLNLINGSAPVPPGATRSAEVRHQGELLGVLSVVKRRGETLTPMEQKLVDDLAHQAGLVLKNVGLTAELLRRIEELRASRQRLVTAQDEERRRLERNLHDGAQQNLVALKVKLGLVQMLAARDPEKAKTTVRELKADADTALETLRDLARGIYPPLLAEKGLVTALESQARKATVAVTVEASGVGRYPQDVEATVYFCVLEALQNVQKYARASSVTVRVRDSGETLQFEVADDGAGFDAGTASLGTGLNNLRDRLDAIDGALEIDSTPGSGTTVRGRVPSSASTLGTTLVIAGAR